RPNVVRAFDIHSMKMLWEMKDVFLAEVKPEILVLTDKDNNRKNYDYRGRAVEKPVDYVYDVHDNILVCSPDNVLYKDFAQLLHKKQQPYPHHKIQYVETDHFLVLSYGYMQGQSIRYKILAFDDSGEIRLDEDIFKDNKGLIDACFFLFGKSILFLDNDYCLKGYEIT
ncbi:MAG TPA: hypothetical protein VL947_07175, partial [Cytophagales bacterium]|nr:hypothetical protein [Cytophagales bacterium]